MKHIVFAILAVAMFAACTGAEDGANITPPAEEEQAAVQPSPTGAEGGTGTQVRVEDFAFAPETLSVASGETIVWDYSTNGAAQHSVDFDDGEQSDVLRPGDTYERTFEVEGDYPYVCRFHPNMTGTVTVQ